MKYTLYNRSNNNLQKNISNSDIYQCLVTPINAHQCPSMPFTPCWHPSMPIDTYQCHNSVNVQSKCTFLGGCICLSWLMKKISLVINIRCVAFSGQALQCLQKCGKVHKSVMNCDTIQKKCRKCKKPLKTTNYHKLDRSYQLLVVKIIHGSNWSHP